VPSRFPIACPSDQQVLRAYNNTRRCIAARLLYSAASIRRLLPNLYFTSKAQRLLRTLFLAILEPTRVMRLLQCDNNGGLSQTEFFESEIPDYAILSHRWEAEEVTFRDIQDVTSKSKAGYSKIQFCGEQARRDGLQYFWVDTCCIDKSNSTELAEAINSMFRWYQKAARCYVYLSDVSTKKQKVNDISTECTWESAFRASKWFTRGWTLQELLAPTIVEFFSQEGKRLGDKRILKRCIQEITGISISALEGAPLSQFGIDERLSWAKNRQTTRAEDRAYSLLGIFGIHLSLIYGEGSENAFKRLKKKIQKSLTGKYTIS
jgi:Heterokaryon incompatibility protein (HET)